MKRKIVCQLLLLKVKIKKSRNLGRYCKLFYFGENKGEIIPKKLKKKKSEKDKSDGKKRKEKPDVKK